MLTRRSAILSGAAAGAVPFVPRLSSACFAEAAASRGGAAAAPVVFSPTLSHYVASSGAVVTRKIASEGLSVKSLKGAASLVRIAADHTHQNQLDTVVRVLLAKQPSLAQASHLHTVMTQAFTAYQQSYHKEATMPDLSGILNLKPEQSAAALAYVSRVGMTGVLRDTANMLGTAAHERRSLGLKQAGLVMHDGSTLGDGVWNMGAPLHLQHVCSVKQAKEVLCSRAATGADAGIGLGLAALTLACTPWALAALNAEFPGISIPVDAACATFALDPVQAVAIVGGFIVAVIGAVQWVAC